MGGTYPSLEETANHPAYAGAIWNLEPTKKGVVAAAKSRGGPVNIAWEMHGNGPIKVLLVMGLAGIKSSWQRQTVHFGHDRESQYTVLLVDNRGIGESDKPLARYTTSGMARDLLDVLDDPAVGWTSPRGVHVVGISMGGMIAQELACLAPERIRTLTLLSSSSRFENPTLTWREAFLSRLSLVVPRSLQDNIETTALRVFPPGFADLPDECPLPSQKRTPRCGPAPASAVGSTRPIDAVSDGEYGRFESNFQRFQAQEMHKRLDPTIFSARGLYLQMLASAGHHKSEAQLRAMADAVGRERIAVVHGTADRMIHPSNGEKLIKYIEPAVGEMIEGMGHAAVMERVTWLNEFLAARFAAGESIDVGHHDMS